MKSTVFFVGFVGVLLTIGLNFRPGHTASLDRVWEGQDGAFRWLTDLLDLDHDGLNAISFSIACLTSVGVVGWVFYTAYGMAAMPFDWLQRKQTATEQRQDLQSSLSSLREKYRMIQSKYPSREDGSLDPSCMKAADRKEFSRLQREHKSLMQHNYKLQELEQKGGYARHEPFGGLFAAADPAGQAAIFFLRLELRLHSEGATDFQPRGRDLPQPLEGVPRGLCGPRHPCPLHFLVFRFWHCFAGHPRALLHNVRLAAAQVLATSVVGTLQRDRVHLACIVHGAPHHSPQLHLLRLAEIPERRWQHRLVLSR
mmetsp:Transcript_75038/g.195531  ORF Transcript_75038/g.195531 Transcript_75038/m.195531 type:complete len:312 (-) Transcript_75038:131-1066(-)